MLQFFLYSLVFVGTRHVMMIFSYNVVGTRHVMMIFSCNENQYPSYFRVYFVNPRDAGLIECMSTS